MSGMISHGICVKQLFISMSWSRLFIIKQLVQDLNINFYHESNPKVLTGHYMVKNLCKSYPVEFTVLYDSFFLPTTLE